MAKQEVKTEKIEREYIIPLREKCRVVPRYKKTPKAIRTIKEFLVKHMKIYDRDLRKIKIVVPELKTQEKIVAGVKTIYNKARNLRQEAETVIVEAQKQTEQMIFA